MRICNRGKWRKSADVTELRIDERMLAGTCLACFGIRKTRKCVRDLVGGACGVCGGSSVTLCEGL